MDLFVHTLVSGLVQFALAVLIAFVWWWFSARHQRRFTQWIGLTKIDRSREDLELRECSLS